MSLWTDLLGMPYDLRTVDVKGVPTRALRAGKGRPIVFLHGISGHLEAFLRTAPAHVAAGFEVHLIDMLGHGYTGKPDVDYTPDVLARHVLDYMDVQGLATANLTGISLGGWVVGWILVHHPERVERATMVLAVGNPAMSSPKVAKLVADSTTAAVMSDDREYTRKRLEQVIYNKSLVTDELVEVRYKIYHQPEFRARLGRLLYPTQAEVYAKYMLSETELRAVDREVLLAWSEEDAYSDVMGADYYVKNFPKNKLVVFKDAGHWPPYERPDDFARINTDFFKGGLSAVKAGAI
jgi:2-hydroxy-6-oxonona-2,4-dienedioate hydrolase